MASFFHPSSEWHSENSKHYQDMVISSLKHVQDLLDSCSKEGLRICCHILTAIARFQHAFLTVNRKMFNEIGEVLTTLCIELYCAVHKIAFRS